MNNIILFLGENAEWVYPLVMLLVGELLIRLIPTKDPTGLTERIGKIITKIFDVIKIKNSTKKIK